MSSSLPLSCKLTSTPQSIGRPKPIISLSTTIPKLTTNTFSFPQCKPLSSSSTRSLVPYAVPSSGNEAGTAETLSNEEEVYKLAREEILKKLEALEGKVQELKSQPQKGKMVDKKTNKDSATRSSSQLEGILKDSYALGMEVLELESNNPSQTTPSSTSTIFETILQQFNQETVRSNRLVEVNPQPNPGPTAEMIDRMVREMVDAYYHEEPPVLEQIDYKYAPIRKETPPTEPLTVFNVQGKLPEDLEGGMYLRVGPDPVFDPEANYKWLDGDGMVHAVRFENGKAIYVSRYVKNSRYLQEQEFGKAKFFKYGDFEGAYGLFVAYIQILRARLNVLDMSFGSTTSNVGMIYHAGQVMALEDFGKPYVLNVTDDGDLVTLGMNDYGGNLNHNFTPHPKKDAVTGEMFIVGLAHTAPYATYSVVGKDGQIKTTVPLTVSHPTYMHDLAITENFVIILDNPYLFSPETMVTKDKWIFHFDPTEKSRIGILPRYAEDESEIKWFEFEQPFFVFHTANAWEEDGGNTVIMYGCVLDAVQNVRTGDFDIYPYLFRNFSNKDSGGSTPEPEGLTFPDMYKFTFNLSTGEATRVLEPNFLNAPVDTPRINELYMARKNRYVYTTQFSKEAAPIGFIKYDLETKTQVSLGLGDNNLTFSEPVFVPKKNATAEDDGYLIFFLHTLNTAHLVVINAQLPMRYEAWVDLPSRIPLGFHSIYVTKEELEQQVKTM